MFDKMLSISPAYTIVERPTSEIITQYRELLPPEMVAIWQQYGFGTFREGYLKVVNPNDYHELLRETYQVRDINAVVLFATAMGDLIIYERGFLVLVDYRHGELEIIGQRLKFFFKDLTDEVYLATKLRWQPYQQARARLGEPAYDECYGYVPLLALGGVEQADRLERVKLREHISLMTSFVGVLS